MRLLALGISALALGACSVGGGYSWKGGHGSYDQGSYDYVSSGNYGHTVSHGSYYAPQPTGCHVNPCAPAYTPPPPPAPCYVNPCAPVYTPPPPPVYIPPAPKPLPPVAPCHDPCAGGGYAVSPYAYGVSHAVDGPSYGPSYYDVPQKGGDYFYGTLGGVWYDVDEPILGLQGRVGYMGGSGFGVEAEGSVGVVSKTTDFDTPNPPGPNLVGTIEEGVDYSFAGFALARFALSQNIAAHARVGYHTTKEFNDVTTNGVLVENSTTLDGVAFGAGMEFNLTPKDALRADFTRYEDDAAGKDTLSLAYLRRF